MQLASDARGDGPRNPGAAGRGPAWTRPVASSVVVAVVALAAITGCGGADAAARTEQPTVGSELVVDGQVRVDVVRTGGFAGLETRSSVDTASLPESEARKLVALVEDLDVEALQQEAAPTHTVPDAFIYDIVISGPGRTVRLRAQDPNVPAQLRPLIQFVDQRT